MGAAGFRRIAALTSVLIVGLATQGVRAQDAAAGARLEALRARLQALDQRSDRVADLNTIENLQRSFGYYFDKMLWEQVLDLFSDDATLEIGTSGVFVGKDSIRAYLYGISGGVEGPLEGVLFEHMQLQPIVTVAADGTTARGRWRTLLLTGVSGSGSGGNWGEGPYENEYVKDDGVWKISRLHWFGSFYAPYEGGWLNADSEALKTYSAGGGTEPDRPPSIDYEPYPAAFTPPFHYENPGN